MPSCLIDGLVNVHDTSVLHGSSGGDSLVEVDGHIGHGSVLHGCVVRRGARVGMNALVMDEAEAAVRPLVATKR